VSFNTNYGLVAGITVIGTLALIHNAERGHLYYFAYGALLNRKLMLSVAPQAKPRQSVTLAHYRLVFSGWSRQSHGGLATLKSFRGERVKGGLYDIDEASLRKIEQYLDAPRTFVQLKVMVNTESGESFEATTHVRARAEEESKPAPEYLALIQQGYRDWDLL